MTDTNSGAAAAFHNHVFLGEGHERSERKTWARDLRSAAS